MGFWPKRFLFCHRQIGNDGKAGEEISIIHKTGMWTATGLGRGVDVALGSSEQLRKSIHQTTSASRNGLSDDGLTGGLVL